MKNKIEVRGLFAGGNAFAILAKANRAARRAGWSEEQWAAFSAKAKAGDFDHLLQTVMAEFDEAGDE